MASRVNARNGRVETAENICFCPTFLSVCCNFERSQNSPKNKGNLPLRFKILGANKIFHKKGLFVL